MDKFFRLEVDSKYSATKTSVDEEIDDERGIYLILPNGTMIIKNPRVTKFVERYVRRNNEEPVNKFASKYIVREYTKPWDSDPECIEYAEEIKRKAVGEHVESYSDCDATKKENLLEIKLKDTDSVPEVYYRGQRMDEMPKSLVDIAYHWHREEDEYQAPRGANDITIEYYDSPNNKYLDRKIIGHKRDM
ncbi:hypothetical protein [Enterococcus durans]|uniref:hypothetical protein n=1 Tax=Enterococcus durans TaxID=53345 RepID=UPI0021AB2419|nr:hypothetical protein [Enterococcus durans]